MRDVLTTDSLPLIEELAAQLLGPQNLLLDHGRFGSTSAPPAGPIVVGAFAAPYYISLQGGATLSSPAKFTHNELPANHPEPIASLMAAMQALGLRTGTEDTRYGTEFHVGEITRATAGVMCTQSAGIAAGSITRRLYTALWARVTSGTAAINQEVEGNPRINGIDQGAVTSLALTSNWRHYWVPTRATRGYGTNPITFSAQGGAATVQFCLPVVSNSAAWFVHSTPWIGRL